MVTAACDKVYWVTKSEFEAHFDQHDFVENRDVRQVSKYYLEDWFCDVDGAIHFLVPTVQFVNGYTQFINGRHRTAVIYSVTDRAPIAFPKGASQEFANSSGFVELALDERIELPDFPIKSQAAGYI